MVVLIRDVASGGLLLYLFKMNPCKFKTQLGFAPSLPPLLLKLILIRPHTGPPGGSSQGHATVLP